jgi:hypothetical protein
MDKADSIVQLKGCSGIPTYKLYEKPKPKLSHKPKLSSLDQGTLAKPLIKRARRRGPKTSFKIPKNEANVEKLEKVLTGFIDKNKTLKSACDDIILHPQNRIQASMNTLKAINRILPSKNLVNRAFGYDEDNLDKNHLTLEKVMLERIVKLKKRREEQAQTKEKERAMEGSAAMKEAL